MAKSNQFVQATTHSMDCVCESCLLLSRDMCQVAWYRAALTVLSPTASKYSNTRSTILSIVMSLVQEMPGCLLLYHTVT